MDTFASTVEIEIHAERLEGKLTQRIKSWVNDKTLTGLFKFYWIALNAFIYIAKALKCPLPVLHLQRFLITAQMMVERIERQSE